MGSISNPYGFHTHEKLPMPCPICDKTTDPLYRPFCSKRCANVDLGRWLNESYTIPVADHEESDSEDRPDADADPKPH